MATYDDDRCCELFAALAAIIVDKATTRASLLCRSWSASPSSEDGIVALVSGLAASDSNGNPAGAEIGSPGLFMLRVGAGVGEVAAAMAANSGSCSSFELVLFTSTASSLDNDGKAAPALTDGAKFVGTDGGSC